MNKGKGRQGAEKTAHPAIYGEPCNYCKQPIPQYIEGKKFCDTDCKNSFHKEARLLGAKQLKSGGIRYARLSNSPRLQRLLKFLSDGKPHSTRDIIIGAGICAISTAVKELRMNGFNIPCKLKTITEDGSKIFEYQLIRY